MQSASGTLLFVGNGTTLNSSDRVVVGRQGNLIGGDGTLINIDNTISGSGLIMGHSAFRLVNHGVIDATERTTRWNFDTIGVVNTGIIEASGTPSVIKQTTIDNVRALYWRQDALSRAL